MTDTNAGPVKTAHELRAEAEAKLDRLRAENARLIEDRARFPDRPDDVGRMIGAHFENLKAKAAAAEVAHDRVQLLLHATRAENEALRADAERYCCLRDWCGWTLATMPDGALLSISLPEISRRAMLSKRDFDTAIDAARAAMEGT